MLPMLRPVIAPAPCPSPDKFPDPLPDAGVADFIEDEGVEAMIVRRTGECEMSRVLLG